MAHTSGIVIKVAKVVIIVNIKKSISDILLKIQQSLYGRQPWLRLRKLSLLLIGRYC